MLQSCLCWLHVGDLHAREADGWLGPRRLRRVLEEAADALAPGAVDFVYLPGDNANEGEAGQYAGIEAALAASPPIAPMYAVPGDHDFVPGNLAAFRAFLNRGALPRPPASLRIRGRRVVLLDIVSAGAGGPAFDLGRAQAVWLQRELDEARGEDALPPVVLMHAFPGDLAVGGEEVAAMFARAGVALVDTGHTHYNELINDGEVVYAAARSTAQIEEEGEDAYGMAFAAVDGAEASFRFRRAGSGWPFVMITSPADQRLQVRPVPLDAEGRLCVRAKVFGADARARVTLHALGRATPMAPVADEVALWSATLPAPWRATLEALAPPERLVRLAVRAQTPDGRVGEDAVQVGPKRRSPPAGRAGAHGGSIGAWVEHSVLGTRLGPNAFGKDW